MDGPPRFIHLRVHTAYSLLEGAIHVEPLVRRCQELGAPAVAVTDSGNLFAALEFSETAASNGVQPIIGCQLDVAVDDGSGGAERSVHGGPRERPDRGQRPIEGRPSGNRLTRVFPVVLLAKNETGYRNLVGLNSFAFLEAGGSGPHVGIPQLEARAEGLICLSGGAGGPIGRLLLDGQTGPARALMERLGQIFGDRLYVEVQRHPVEGQWATEDERATEPQFLDMAYSMGLPLVATNDVHFDTRDMHSAQDALLCIKDGTYVDQKEPRRRLTEHHYLKSSREMEDLFVDLPEAVDNSMEIARRCAFRVPSRDPILPKLTEREFEELERQSRDGLERRLKTIPLAVEKDKYRSRLEFELRVIEDMGFAGYFLIVADVVQWARRNDIPVGPGRGSGAGSLVAYALTITDLDPLRYSLLFERFMNPERVSMPDFDIDFCVDRREDVISYVQKRYGADRVAQIITFGALLSKAAVRDVGRVLQIPYGRVDRLAKLIPVDGVRPLSIPRALSEQPRLREEADNDPAVARMLDIAGQIEGLLRNASTHAAGVVVGDRPLDELIPIYKDSRSEMPVSQFNMKWVERAGLVKLDFLGLKTLTVIKNALDLLRERDIDVDISDIPLDDSKTYGLYATASTVGVFQVESSGMKSALRRMKPTCIEDIVALVALYRPGPMESIPKYCNVKNGLESRDYLHESIDPILDETQGIIIYQEQVMQIVRAMAGYSLSGADVVRQAMGKKIQSAMDAERPKFLEGAARNGIGHRKAAEVWDLLKKFANYGFNKSHAVAYGVVSYQTAWLKANHPVEFMAAVMNGDLHNTDKLQQYRQEVDRLGINLRSPCVNRSKARFVVSDGGIDYALGGLKNAGAEAMRMIESARFEAGPFADIFDFARRLDLRRLGRRQLETLVRAGALDALDPNRARLLGGIDILIGFSASAHDRRDDRQIGLFGDGGEALPPPELPATADWSLAERLANEYDAIGFFLSGHPLDVFGDALGRLGVIAFAELERRLDDAKPETTVTARLAGSVVGRQDRRSASGNRYAFVQLSDASGSYEVMVFSDVLEGTRSLLEVGANVVLDLEPVDPHDSQRLRVRSVESADRATSRLRPVGVRLFIDRESAIASVAAQLAGDGREGGNGRGCPVRLVLMDPNLPGEVEVCLADRFPVTPPIRNALTHIPGVHYVEDMSD
ncbi:MAG: DNA polymerase III subunit alpha [Paracoccaceae bacterium]|nr:DNA polymerase III subunit alpha [Paracoccaceae bacterium]